METRKRVGIVTLYHRNYNYGGLLQAYALQKVFANKGADCEVLTFDVASTGHVLRRLSHFRPDQALDAVSRRLRANLIAGRDTRALRHRREHAFGVFEESIPHTAPIGDGFPDSLDGTFDLLVCGSDQVWNPAWWNDVLLLEGVDGRRTIKASYAASMGCSSLSDRDTSRLSKALTDFEFVSVREHSACALISKITGGVVQPTVTLDPTLLMGPGEWLASLANEPEFRVPSEPYAFVYLVDKQDRYTDQSLEACRREGLRCVAVSYDLEAARSLGNDPRTTLLADCRPDEWVRLLAGAEVVITDSFHGVAFSSNFNKPFWCFRKTETLNGSHKDDRQEALLGRLGLSERMVDAEQGLPARLIDELSFSVCNETLFQERRSSLAFLDECLRRAGV